MNCLKQEVGNIILTEKHKICSPAALEHPQTGSDLDNEYVAPSITPSFSHNEVTLEVQRAFNDPI